LVNLVNTLPSSQMPYNQASAATVAQGRSVEAADNSRTTPVLVRTIDDPTNATVKMAG
jgi:hypothetical protein